MVDLMMNLSDIEIELKFLEIDVNLCGVLFIIRLVFY